ncbi:hypothetical protein Agub_g7186 [Astrephomene gubernaculifera]|uniref:RING-type domain-containing protein n=1 Tax=Astrephomene gubernaculifera TaxID=47775 RepID=A0AAD3DQ93_9CHLO|nr:hypothetical protein Agub_g7186 [Astrephomene gubernaculifera]
MGCSASALAAADLNKSLRAGSGSPALLDKLEACPWLLSTAPSVLTSTAGTPLHVACERKQLQVVQQMFSFLSCSPLSTVREALRPYCRRAGRPLPASVAEGIRIAVDMTNCKGQTPLMYACAAGSPELVKLLLTQGADPWVGDRCGCRTALHYASMAGSVSCIEALMQHLPARDMTRQGVRYINARSLCGLTALHYTVFFDHPAATEELLRHDPQLNAATTCDSYDVYVTCDPFSTPLHFAAVRGTAPIARLLLNHYLVHGPTLSGSPSRDPRLCCNYGQQLPWQVAASHHPSNRELVALLHPAQPLERALGLAGEGAGRGSSPLHVGPPALAALAAAALHAKLAEDLRAAQQQKEQEKELQQQKEQQEQEQQRHQQAAASCAAGGGSAASSSQAGEEECPQAAAASDNSSCPAACAAAAAPPAAVTALGPSTATARQPHAPPPPSPQQQQPAGHLLHKCNRVMPALPHPRKVQEADDEDNLCGVCFASSMEVAPAGCGHGVCLACASELSRGLLAGPRPKPLLCPFCRQGVAGFVCVPREAS